MKLKIELDAKEYSLDVPQNDASSGKQISGYVIDRAPVEADATEIAPGIYSILIGGRSLEVHVAKFGGSLRVSVAGQEFLANVRDPRKWERNHGAAAASHGHQNIVAPMPGRVVRVLVKLGDAVTVGQGIAVVEAMKMQNEVRSAKAGSVERLLVTEGQTVNAGDTIAVIG